MKPLGTITKYYPFIEEKLQRTLNRLMDESECYFEFAQKLAKYVMENDVDVHLAYLATRLIWWTQVPDLIESIALKYHDYEPIQAWKYPLRGAITDQVNYEMEFQKTLIKAIEQCTDDWIRVELYLLDAVFKIPFSVPDVVKSLDAASLLIEDNERLECFSSWFDVIEGVTKKREMTLDETWNLLERGRKAAKMYNDDIVRYESLLYQASIRRDVDIQSSLDLYEQAYSLATALEIPFFISEVMSDCSVSYELSGEFDLAVASASEAVNESHGIHPNTPLLILARIYSRLGMGEKALESINSIDETLDETSIHVYHLRKARALLLLNRLDDAEHHLEFAYPLVLRTDWEMRLSEYYHVTGLLEYARGELHNSLNMLQKSLEILERRNHPLSKIPILRDLANVELSIGLESKDSEGAIVPGQWMTCLENLINNHTLPGLKMEFALLKSDFYLNSGHIQDARQILVDALNLSDSDAFRTLRFELKKRLHAIDLLWI
ncbi:MAG: hypothetical protein ACFFEF_03595 [Candidatus Thorarchaeota archaeon]